MALLNYTTKVPATQTLQQVQRLLMAAGATSISQSFGDGRITGLRFTVDTPLGPRGFVLPVDVDRVHAVLRSTASVRPMYRTVEQAERVAWRIVKDWLEAQLAIIETEMVSFDQVMLPYMHTDDGRTVYELYAERQLALPEAT